jgi:hypothetical protein
LPGGGEIFLAPLRLPTLPFLAPVNRSRQSRDGPVPG